MIYRGCWVVCSTCMFPIRLPYLPKTTFVHKWRDPSRTILLACPVCVHVGQYRKAEFETVGFRVPDPFRRKRASLYMVEVPCAIPHCDKTARIYAVAAATVSVASLLELWRHWVIRVSSCRGHSFKPFPRRTWLVCRVDEIG